MSPERSIYIPVIEIVTSTAHDDAETAEIYKLMDLPDTHLPSGSKILNGNERDPREDDSGWCGGLRDGLGRFL